MGPQLGNGDYGGAFSMWPLYPTPYGTSEACPASLLHRHRGTPRTVTRMHYSSGAFSQAWWSTGLERGRPADLSLLSERLL
jgi:hypothetical protein